MLRELDALEKRLDAVYEAGLWGIEHVGAANYQSREEEAREAINKAMRGEEWQT